MDYGYLHELEIVEFRTQPPRARAELLPMFLSMGFRQYDDVVSLDRTDKSPPWQTSTIVAVEVHQAGREVYGFKDGDWNTLKLGYLLPSLPFAFVDRFVAAVSAVGASLDLRPQFGGETIEIADLKSLFLGFREELLEQTGCEPGDENLAILIQSTYPRR